MSDKNSDDAKGSPGGKARAAKLTPEERKAIASAAAAKRWGIPKEMHKGERKLGGWLIQCSHLDDGRRIISQRSFMELIDMRGRGRDPIGHRMASIIDTPLAKSNKINKLVLDIKSPVKFITKNGVVAFGYEAETVIDYCRVILELRKDGSADGEVFRRYAQRAEGFLVSFAKGGIIALIDEITGFQEVRAKDALAKIIEQFVAEELQDYTSRFPEDFYREIYRLRGWDWNKKTSFRRPRVVAMWTVNFVYKRLPPGVYEELVAHNPKNEKGRRPNKHYQWLTGDVGDPRLRSLLDGVVRLMHGSKGWGEMKNYLNKFYPIIEVTDLGFEVERKTKEDYEFALLE
jgi:hypothetical protein